MQILRGTKREITIAEWKEQLEKHLKRTNDSMECFRRYSEIDDLDRLIENCKKIIENANHAKEAIAFMNENNIE